MVKDAALSIRVAPELKERLEEEAARAGMTVATYAERALEVHSSPPRWQLKDPEVVHSPKTGVTIRLNVAEGWPVLLLTTARAEELSQQLAGAATTAKKLGIRRI